MIDGAQFKITRLRAESSVKVQLVIGLIEKLVKVKSIDILIAGTTDRAVTEQDVMYVDPVTHKPNLSYFEVIEMDKFDQTAPGTGILAAIKGCFTKHKFSKLWDKSIYLSAAGASVNTGKDRTNPSRTWLGSRMVFQSSLGIGTEGCS